MSKEKEFKPFFIEKDWITKAGYRAVCAVMLHRDGMSKGLMSHRNGYLHIPKEVSFHGYDYDTVPVWDVHGGWTFDGNGYFLEDGDPDEHGHWLGFDCMHAGDRYIDVPEEVKAVWDKVDIQMKKDFPDYERPDDVVRDLEFVEAELERVAGAIADYEKTAGMSIEALLDDDETQNTDDDDTEG